MAAREVKGACPECGKEIVRLSPVPLTVVCDCFKKCPICGAEMAPYTPVLSPSTYGPIKSDVAKGDTDHPVDIQYHCQACDYYSSLKPVEVALE